MNWLDHTKTVLISPHDVDCEDGTYYIPSFSDPYQVLNSVREIGIANPPLLQNQIGGRLIPVLGRRRLKAALDIGISNLRAAVLPPEMPQTEGFRLAFWDNIPFRSLDSATTAVVVRRLLQLFPRQAVIDEFLFPVGIRANGPKLERLSKIGGLDPVLLKALATGRILEKTAAILAELSSDDARRLVDFTEHLGMNANKKAEVIGYLFDLSVLNSQSILSFLRDERIIAIVKNTEMPVPERGARVRDFIRSLKFPELAKREEGFNLWLRSVPHSQNISVSPSPAFETPACTVQISADSPAQAEAIIAKLRDTCHGD